jgi:acylphosphatase
MNSRVHVLVSGRVQGVFFRDFTRRWASSLGLTGLVRNRDDGCVEIFAEGEESRIESLVAKVREGPTHARVDDLDISWEAPSGEYTDFRISY